MGPRLGRDLGQHRAVRVGQHGGKQAGLVVVGAHHPRHGRLATLGEGAIDIGGNKLSIHDGGRGCRRSRRCSSARRVWPRREARRRAAMSLALTDLAKADPCASAAARGLAGMRPRPDSVIALANRPLRGGRGHEKIHGHPTRAFAEYGHVGRVAAKGRDIVPHPFQRRDLIHHAEVARAVLARFLRQLRMREPAEPAQPGS